MEIVTQLTPDLLRLAYEKGYFPMPDPITHEIQWFRPDPRTIIPLDAFHVSRSLRRVLNKCSINHLDPNYIFTITLNHAFDQVMRACANRPETWINAEMIHAYGQLHREGSAKSVEVWRENKLVGGIYGVCLAGAFFAESKFHVLPNTSKVALYHLVQHLKNRGFELLEVQFLTEHLRKLGAIEIPDALYQKLLAKALAKKVLFA